jgi:hypothetical protein
MAYGTRKYNVAFICTLIHILSRINPIPRIDTYFFKIHSNIVFPSTPRPPERPLSYRCTCYNFESTPTFLHSGYLTCPSQSSRLSHPDWIRLPIQTLKFLIDRNSNFVKDRKTSLWNMINQKLRIKSESRQILLIKQQALFLLSLKLQVRWWNLSRIKLIRWR